MEYTQRNKETTERYQHVIGWSLEKLGCQPNMPTVLLRTLMWPYFGHSQPEPYIGRPHPCPSPPMPMGFGWAWVRYYWAWVGMGSIL